MNSKIKYVIFDKDNTLTDPYEYYFENYHIESSMRDCQKVFGL